MAETEPECLNLETIMALGFGKCKLAVQVCVYPLTLAMDSAVWMWVWVLGVGLPWGQC
jgi:hypothetical protein